MAGAILSRVSGVEELARGFSYRRQMLGRAAPDPAAALRDVVGVYSSHPSAPLSLYARSASFDADAFRALEVLRLPAMRGSIHLMPRETAHLPFRALLEGPARRAARLKYFNVSEKEYATLRKKVLPVAKKPRSSAELDEAVGAGKKMRGVIGALGREGALLRVGAEGLRSNQLQYVAGEVPDADADEALAWLAGEYLRAFGPVRRQDFAWWAGVTAKRAAAALAAVETEELDDGFLLAAGARKEFEAAKPPARQAVDLLPKWDCYTMGYPAGGRGRFADPGVAERCYDFRGDGRGVVLVGGSAAAAWDARFAGKKMEITLELFEKPAAKLRKAIDAAFEDVALLLGAREVAFAYEPR